MLGFLLCWATGFPFFCMLTELASLCFASKSWHDPKFFGYTNVFALPSADIFWDWGEQMSHPRTRMANRRLWVRWDLWTGCMDFGTFWLSRACLDSTFQPPHALPICWHAKYQCTIPLSSIRLHLARNTMCRDDVRLGSPNIGANPNTYIHHFFFERALAFNLVS